MTAQGMYALGIDLGTTSTKALLLDPSGRVIASASAQHGIDTTADGVQADPEAWWASMTAALSSLSRDADLTGVGSIGFSGNMSAVVLVDEAVTPLAPALLLADQRGAKQIADLDEGLRRRIETTTGNRPSTVFSLSSFLWWRDTDPRVFERAVASLSAKDFLRARLTGRMATDMTDAYNTLLLDPAGEWDDDLIDALGLPRHIFPAVRAADADAGRVSVDAAEWTGLPAGIPVATGAGDVAAALQGMGGLAVDELAISLGTSATIMAALGGAADEPFGAALQGAVTRHPAVDGTWFALGSLLTGGLAVNWLRSAVGTQPISSAKDHPDAVDPLQFLPYLAGTGSPDYDSTATGTVLGVRTSTTAADLVSAALEAVAFDFAGLIDRLESDGTRSYRTIAASGGGTRIPAWPQIIADVTGRPVRLVDEPDLSAVGAAVLGWAAGGLQVAPRHGERVVLPRPENAPAWAVRRARFEASRRLVRELTLELSLLSAVNEQQEVAP